MTKFNEVEPLVVPGITAEIQGSGILIKDTVLGNGDCDVCLQDHATALALLSWLSEACGRGWQPIETAPKGGKWMLLWWPGVTDVPFAGYEVNGRWYGAPTGDTWDRENQPTHWMHLPEPPKAIP